jgi:H+-translocating NAD(P) transhydrogenase subunit alpha
MHIVSFALAALSVTAFSAPVAVNNAYAPSPVMISLTIFVLACFIGYFVVWRVTPALHSPLMAVTNAISSVIIVGAIIAANVSQDNSASTEGKVMGLLAITCASVNIVGGFVITARMLSKFHKRKS